MIPESVRRRLQAQAAGEHPDADLLTAFAEHTLAESECERVLSHLAACQACREVVSLTLPEEESAPEVVMPVAQSWFRWPLLRWTAVAATVIVVWAAVSVLTPRKPADVSVPAASPAAESKTTEPKAEVQAPGEMAAKKTAPATFGAKQKASVEPARTRDENERGAASVATLNGVQTAPAPAISQYKSHPAADLNANQVQKIQNQQLASGAIGKLQADKISGPSQPAKDAELAQTKGKNLEDLKKPQESKEENRKDAFTLDAAAAKAAAVGGISGGALHGNAPAASAKPASPPPPPAAQNEAVSALRQAETEGAPMALARARTQDLGPVRWHVSTSGAVERSADGQTWEKIEIDPSVTFRAISSNDGDLWAGGTGGALFHSSDAGKSWSRVKVGQEGMWVSDTITSVGFPSRNFGMVNTASGAVWETQDGGRSWHRRQ